MKKSMFGLVATVFAVFMVTACQKENNLTENNEQVTITSEDVSDSEAIMQSSEDQMDMDVEAPPPGGTCPSISFAAPRGTYPQTITLNFGTTGCADRHGRTRKGKVIISLSDSLTNLNATKSVSYENYFVDSTKIEGTRAWKNTGRNAAGQPTFTRTATNMKLTFGNGEIATWSASHTVTRTQGYNTPRVFLDDVWSVTGSASGVNRKGKSFSSVIETPVVHTAICPWIVSGKRTVTVENKTRSLDYGYGGGDCDREAELFLANGETRIIRLRR
jgi:hypothetical protein